jgi:hypothetical protein
MYTAERILLNKKKYKSAKTMTKYMVIRYVYQTLQKKITLYYFCIKFLQLLKMVYNLWKSSIREYREQFLH